MKEIIEFGDEMGYDNPLVQFDYETNTIRFIEQNILLLLELNIIEDDNFFEELNKMIKKVKSDKQALESTGD